ncbi:preprotein translocase subunit SecA [Collinsella sp. An271]|uniref:helix-turn-helix domain-containing protein n=1 Tax=Collinsella sp. An271 TaxID=1965616 RepID=UPI000B396BBF|nr:helix-turn-helix transcriptional regulator [Collinsella sp. An271]OUO58737.1 preprotein translocase subunit SecA [Collinsella sp. An271]
MAKEKSTEDLLERLLASSTVDEYLSEGETLDRTLVSYLEELRERLGVKKAAVVRASGLNPTVVYDIFAGKSRPGRDHAIMLAFGLQCSLIETQRLLRLAGVAELWPKVRRDAVIIWCIENGKTRVECEDELWSRGEKTLLGTGPLKRAAV